MYLSIQWLGECWLFYCVVVIGQVVEAVKSLRMTVSEDKTTGLQSLYNTHTSRQQGEWYKGGERDVTRPDRTSLQVSYYLSAKAERRHASVANHKARLGCQ